MEKNALEGGLYTSRYSKQVDRSQSFGVNNASKKNALLHHEFIGCYTGMAFIKDLKFLKRKTTHQLIFKLYLFLDNIISILTEKKATES